MKLWLKAKTKDDEWHEIASDWSKIANWQAYMPSMIENAKKHFGDKLLMLCMVDMDTNTVIKTLWSVGEEKTVSHTEV